MAKYDFVTADNRLKNKKEDLFRGGNIIKWEMDHNEIEGIDKAELLVNKELAMSKMLVKVNTYL